MQFEINREAAKIPALSSGDVDKYEYLKVGLSPSKQNSFYLLQWNPIKSDEKCFIFILKALLVLKIFKFLSWLFGHAEKRLN